ncbi:MAG: EamA family transporter [Actinomycetota bacterium]
MAILIALLTAVTYGTADYLGGHATKKMTAMVVTFVGQLGGLVVLAFATWVSGIPAPSAADWGWSALAGVAGSTGLLAFYTAMSSGYMTVVAPVTAVMNALIPIVFGLALGERPGVLALVGMPLAICAVALISDVLGPFHRRAPARVVLLGAAGGSCFGMILVFLHQTSDGSGVWPVLIMRFVSTPFMMVLIASTRPSFSQLRSNKAVVLGSGILDSLANWFYVLAVREGLLSVVAVIVTLYPATTMALAVAVDKERIHRPQAIGVGLAATALVLIALA